MRPMRSAREHRIVRKCLTNNTPEIREIALTFELQVIGDTVPNFALSSPARPAVLDADDVLQFARAGRLVALVLGAARHVASVGEAVEELARLGGRVEHVLRRQA